MRVRFWGTRGSLAKPGPETLRYGGNTSCVEIRSAAGTVIVIDCGTGGHNLGQALMAESDQPMKGHMLISHTHWDHIQGIPFFAPLFAPDHEWDIYAPHSLSQSVRETLAGQMQYTYFPVTIESLGAKIQYHDLVEGTFELGDVTVRSRYLNHPALTLGYRLEVDGVTVVYACDHEPFPREQESESAELGGQNSRHIEFLRGADLVIHDAQYTEAQFPEKVGWGHSTGRYAVEVCKAAGVRQLALTHHDPLRTDEQVDEIVRELKEQLLTDGSDLKVFAAAEGELIQLTERAAVAGNKEGEWFSAVESVVPALSEYSVLLGATDTVSAGVIREAATAENITLMSVTGVEDALAVLEKEQPALVIVDEHVAADEAVSICRKVKALATDDTPQVPIVVLAAKDSVIPQLAEFSTDTLVKPFSLEYMRTRLRAWLLRTTCRWARARRLDNEDARIAALNELGILDTEPEERFDRITRIAAESLDVPIALVSLIDRDRQWFKSCVGLETRETPRDMAFCDHAIIQDDVLIVPDTFLDARFADNPLVTAGDVRIRFYAGCPLRLPSGHSMGTLCLIDSRPRQFDSRQINLLKEFARLAEAELIKKPE